MRILALGAHPDDIEFGCGASLMRFASAGHEVDLYVATYGELGGNPEERKHEQEEAAAFIGARHIFWGGYPDCRLPPMAELVSGVEQVIRAATPDYVFVHNIEDTHQDHRILSSAAVSATRYIPNFLFYEGPTTVNFFPSVYINIEGFVDSKLELLKKHASQISKVNVNLPEISILDIAASTAHFRGIQGKMKVAESFKSLRLSINIPKIVRVEDSGGNP